MLIKGDLEEPTKGVRSQQLLARCPSMSGGPADSAQPHGAASSVEMPMEGRSGTRDIVQFMSAQILMQAMSQMGEDGMQAMLAQLKQHVDVIRKDDSDSTDEDVVPSLHFLLKELHIKQDRNALSLDMLASEKAINVCVVLLHLMNHVAGKHEVFSEKSSEMIRDILLDMKVHLTYAAWRIDTSVNWLDRFTTKITAQLQKLVKEQYTKQDMQDMQMRIDNMDTDLKSEREASKTKIKALEANIKQLEEEKIKALEGNIKQLDEENKKLKEELEAAKKLPAAVIDEATMQSFVHDMYHNMWDNADPKNMKLANYYYKGHALEKDLNYETQQDHGKAYACVWVANKRQRVDATGEEGSSAAAASGGAGAGAGADAGEAAPGNQ